VTSATAALETGRQVDHEPGVGFRHTLAVLHGFGDHPLARYSDSDTFMVCAGEPVVPAPERSGRRKPCRTRA
jgi:hypothetical protein